MFHTKMAISRKQQVSVFLCICVFFLKKQKIRKAIVIKNVVGFNYNQTIVSCL